MDQENNLGTSNLIVSPPQQPVPSPIPNNAQGSRKRIGVIILVVIVILVIVLGVTAFFMKKNSGAQPDQVTQTPTSVIEISTTPDAKEESFEVTLEKNKKTDINFNGISLTYISSEVPGETCFDCISSTVVTAEVNGETKDILYECGGITGECIVRQEVFGIGLELVQQIDTNTVRMKVHYKK